MKTENLIVLIGGVTVVGWLMYKRRKDRLAKQNAASAAVVAPPEVTQSNAVPRRDIQQGFKLVMPSDMISPSVRQKAAMLTARRYSVEQTNSL